MGSDLLPARLVWLAAFAAATAVAAACTPTPAPDAGVRCSEVVLDLLADPETGRVSRPAELDAEALVPDAGVLRLEARVKPRPGAERASAELVVSVAGRRRDRRTVEAGDGPVRVTFEIPLDDLAGRRVDIRLESDARDANAFWRRATVERTRTVPRRPADAGPDVLLIVVDTLRADHCGPYGAARPTTPNLDRFAEEAVTVDDAIAQGPWTLPSVASLFTGLYPAEHGLVAGTERLGWGLSTIAERLQELGVTTIAVSANRLVGPSKQLDQGFERFRLMHQARADAVVAAYLEELGRAPRGQRFSYLHFMDPHTPYDPPPATAGTFSDQDYDGPYADPRAVERASWKVNFGLEAESPPTERDLDHLRALYDEEILAWDREFGRLLERLEADGALERTVVIVTSDHGEEFLDHGMLKHGRQLYRESIRVPLLIRPAGGLDRGVRIPGPFELRHLGGLVIAAVDGEPDLPGRLTRRVGPAFSAASRQAEPRTPWPRESLTAVQDGLLKRIDWLDEDRVEVFDLERDPRELQPLGAEPRGSRLSEQLDRWTEESRSASGADNGAGTIDPDDLEDLRALGYIQ